MLNKPDGYTCSTEDPGDTIYDLLPPRFSKRNPGLNPVGRLDKDTTGLLLMTDDGKFLHQVIHPKSGCLKLYHAVLARPLRGDEGEVFGSGEFLLESETKPLLPAGFEALGEKEALITLHEGRYHQVRRMFAAVGNHVVSLKRISIGGLKLPEDLAEGEWREVSMRKRRWFSRRIDPGEHAAKLLPVSDNYQPTTITSCPSKQATKPQTSHS
jgi:16S rRNA pseudouridine516 synthase